MYKAKQRLSTLLMACLTFIVTVLLALTLWVPSTANIQASAATGNYVKVTETPTDWSGDYLIVYEAGKVAFNGSLTALDAASNNVAVTINDGKIEATDAMKKIQFTIAKSGTSYTIKSKSGYYIGNTADSNKLNSSTSTKYTNTITLNGDKSVQIVGSGKSVLRYNANSGNYRFRYFKSGTYTSQKAIHLYKYEEAASTDCDHANATVTTVPATCTAAGSETLTCACGYTKSTAIAALNHKNKTEVGRTDATCSAVGEIEYDCPDCGETITEEIEKLPHTFVGGECEDCGAVQPTEVTLNFATTAQRVSQTATQQVWADNGVTLTNNKGSSTSDIIDSSNPVRFYKNSEIVVTYQGMLISQIVFNCNTADYATSLKTSIGASATVSGQAVTVAFANPAEEFTVKLTDAKVFVNSMTVSGTVASTEPVSYYTLSIVNGEETKTFKFAEAVDPANGVEYTTADLAQVLADNLPANTDSMVYAYKEAIPETFELKSYTFNVTSTKKVTVTEALSEAVGTNVIVSGTVCGIYQVYNEQYDNISVYITDESGKELLVYRLKGNYVVGDIITVTGKVAAYNSVNQIGEGGTAVKTGHDDSYDYVEKTIEEALVAEDGTNVIVTGTVVKITDDQEQYNNISVYIADENGTRLYLYRLDGKVALNDIIKVKGTMDTYGNERQVAGGTYEKLGTHTCSKYTEATCTKAAACVVCGKENGTALGHDYQGATCTEGGVCSVCQVVGAPLGHDEVAHNAQAVTCTDKGWNAYVTCTRCDYTTYEEIPAAGHKYADATCTLPKTCSVCQATEGEALGHSFAAATCTLPKTCSVCQATEGEALGHNYADATCTLPKTCSVCQATEGEALGHKYADATCTLPKTCSVCQATEGEALGHKYADATCTAPKTCSVCQATEGEALGHKYADATCTAPKTCTVCQATEGEALGHNYADATCTAPKTCTACGVTEGNALGHKFEGGSCSVCGTEEHDCIYGEATCTKAELCTICGATKEGSVALGHDFQGATCTQEGVCVRCQEVGEKLPHSFADATCTTPKTCTVCQATEGEALGHNYAAATCTAPKTCTVCQATEGEALGHSFADATCTTPKTCTVCQATEGEALGHDYADATCTLPKTCSVCQATEGEALGHSYADATCQVPATCSVCGAEKDKVLADHNYVDGNCSVCGKVEHICSEYTEATCKIPAFCVECGAPKEGGELAAHTYGEASCHAPAVCTVCGVEKDDVLADHNYVDGKCTMCNKADPDYKPEEPKDEPTDEPTEEPDPELSLFNELKNAIDDIFAPVQGYIPGCSGVVGGIAGGVSALGIALVTLLKKKENKDE